MPISFEGVAWHRHEMLFGFVGAAVAGFLLTAVPNWTGRLPIAGKPLLSLFGLWAAARLAVLFASFTGYWLAVLLDVGFFITLALLCTREVAASKNRNLPIVGMVLALGLADAADYAGSLGLLPANLGWRVAIALLVLMISLIGGRIIPSFTRNWMMKHATPPQRLPAQPQGLDLLVIASTALALLLWLIFPGNDLTGFALILAAAGQALRLSRWGGYRTAGDPLLLILHLGYAWVPVGLLLVGLAVAGVDIPQSAGVHALTVGAMSTMILAVMSRASLGHTGHALKASAMTIGAYLSVTLAALLRVAASIGIGPSSTTLEIAGGFWITAMLLFAVAYAPILWRRSLSDR